MTQRFLLVIALVSVCGIACGGDDDREAAFDAGSVTSDADPNAPDADPNAPDADPNAPDANPNAPDAGANAGITCGDETCEGEQVCCLEGGQMCTNADACEGTALGCDGPEDCSDGNLCCGAGEGTMCTAADSCEAEICHIDEDCSTDGDECCTLPASDTGICRANCPGPPG